jgi:hypothetical protein
MYVRFLSCTAVGSGGLYAQCKLSSLLSLTVSDLWAYLYHLPCFTAAAIALLDYGDLSAEDIVRKSMKIAGDICVYTNHNLIIEKLEPQGASGSVHPTAETTTSTSTDGSVSDAVGTAGPTSPGTSVGTMDAKASP